MRFPRGSDGGHTNDKDETQLLDACPSQRIFLLLVGWMLRSRDIINSLCAGEELFFDEDIFDETVDKAGADGGIRFGP